MERMDHTRFVKTLRPSPGHHKTAPFLFGIWLISHLIFLLRSDRFPVDYLLIQKHKDFVGIHPRYIAGLPLADTG
jgi:hypothetical protein